MSININIVEKLNKNECSIDDEAMINILFKMIWDSNPRRCVKSNSKSILVRNYFIDEKQDKWDKQKAIMTGNHQWQLVEKAEISLINDPNLNSITILYTIDIQLYVIWVSLFSIVFGFFTGIAFYHGNSSISSGFFSGFIVFFIVIFSSFLIVLSIVKRHKISLGKCISEIKKNGHNTFPVNN
jgi:hypothetical protein